MISFQNNIHQDCMRMLAKEISLNFNNVDIKRNYSENNSSEDRYCGNTKEMINLMKKYNLKPKSLNQQIKETISIFQSELN